MATKVSESFNSDSIAFTSSVVPVCTSYTTVLARPLALWFVNSSMRACSSLSNNWRRRLSMAWFAI